MNTISFNGNWICNGKTVTLPHDAQISEKRGKDVSAAGPICIAVRPEKAEARPGEIVYFPVNIEDETGVVESNDDRRLTGTAEIMVK